MILKAEVW